MVKQVNLALFGTSADPPTRGHQSILRWLSDHFDWVAVWAADNPFKEHQTALNHRMAMLELAIADLNLPRRNISLNPELSYPRTLMTVERARQQWPGAILSLVIGSDLISQLPRWYRVEELFAQVQLVVVPRPGYPLEETDLSQVRQMGARVTIADMRAPAVSSTAYRERRETDALTPPIKAYIYREQLYDAWQNAPQKSSPIPEKETSRC